MLTSTVQDNVQDLRHIFVLFGEQIAGNGGHDEESGLRGLPRDNHIGWLQKSEHVLEHVGGSNDKDHILDQLCHSITKLAEIFAFFQKTVQVWFHLTMSAQRIDQSLYKGRSILVQIVPNIATRCRLSNIKNQNWKFEFYVKNLVKMKGVLRYVA